MKICFPVESNEGLESAVYGHFGSAPLFLVIDTETREVQSVINRDQHHAHGACQPIKALGGHQVDGVVVGGIGGGALRRLAQNGIVVYRAEGTTVAENIACLALEGLSEITADQVCGGHGQEGGHGSGCGHH